MPTKCSISTCKRRNGFRSITTMEGQFCPSNFYIMEKKAMDSVIDIFWRLIQDVKAQSGSMDILNSPTHPLNRTNHPLKAPIHPLRSPTSPANNKMNRNVGTLKLKIIRNLINEHILMEHAGHANKQSSNRVSSIAGKVLAGYRPTNEEIKMLAASVLSQDESAPNKKNRR